MGRPTALTPEVHKRVVDAVRAGSYVHEAAEYAGIHEATVYRWVNRGQAAARRDAGSEDTDWEFREFYESVMEARAGAKVEAIGIVRRLMTEGRDEISLRAATWFLERSDPARWGRIQRPPERSAPGETVEERAQRLLRLAAEYNARQDFDEPSVA